MIYFTSDSHFGHKNVLKHCSRPYKSVGEMNEALILEWNNTVGPNDTVYHLGDVSFHKDPRPYLSRLNGFKHVCIGNHDKVRELHECVEEGILESVGDTKYVRWEGHRFFLSHYAHRVWNKSHMGVYHLYGHCVDEQTQILCSSGWRSYNEISKTDVVYSYNPSTRKLEHDQIKEVIINPGFEGEAYRFSGKSVDYLVTSGHCMVSYRDKNLKLFTESPASIFCNASRRYLVLGGEINNEGIDLSDDEISLYIALAADGNVCNSSLGRIVVFKESKILFIGTLLERMRLEHRRLPQSNGAISFNFTIPDKILALRIKGLDESLVEVTPKQFKVILDTYAETDGSRVGNSVIIYSAKEEEVDLLQHLSVINGYRATKYTRTREDPSCFSTKPQFQLCVTQSPICSTNVNNSRPEKINYKGLTWCIKNKNGNFLMRRNGKVHLTGNCHGDLPGIGRSMDVGVDAVGARPISAEKIIKLLEDKPYTNHH